MLAQVGFAIYHLKRGWETVKTAFAITKKWVDTTYQAAIGFVKSAAIAIGYGALATASSQFPVFSFIEGLNENSTIEAFVLFREPDGRGNVGYSQRVVVTGDYSAEKIYRAIIDQIESSGEGFGSSGKERLELIRRAVGEIQWIYHSSMSG